MPCEDKYYDDDVACIGKWRGLMPCDCIFMLFHIDVAYIALLWGWRGLDWQSDDGASARHALFGIYYDDVGTTCILSEVGLICIWCY